MGLKMVNCAAEGNGGDGFHFGAGVDGELDGCTATNNKGTGFRVDGPAELAAEMKAAVAAGANKEGLVAQYASRAKALGVSLAALASLVDGADKLVDAFLKATGR